MRHLVNEKEELEVYKAHIILNVLCCPVRILILEEIGSFKEVTFGTLVKNLQLNKRKFRKHLHVMEMAGIIEVNNTHPKTYSVVRSRVDQLISLASQIVTY